MCLLVYKYNLVNAGTAADCQQRRHTCTSADILCQESHQRMVGWLTFRHYFCGDAQNPSQQAVHVLHQLILNLHVMLTRFLFTVPRHADSS